MAKKPSTVYLEEKFWDMIAKYQIDNGLSSRNDALLLILKEWDILRRIDFNNININVTNENKITSDSKIDIQPKQPIETPNDETENTEVEKKEEIDSRIASGILNMANTMKTGND